MDNNLKTGGKKPLVSALINSPNPKPATLSAPTMLTLSEAASLRLDLKKTIKVARDFKV